MIWGPDGRLSTKPATILSLIGRSVQQEQQEQQQEQLQQEQQSLAMVWAYDPKTLEEENKGKEQKKSCDLLQKFARRRVHWKRRADNAIEGENIVRPGNPEACIQICQEQGITDLFDLKALAKCVARANISRQRSRSASRMRSSRPRWSSNLNSSRRQTQRAEENTGKESHTRKPWIGTFYFSNTIESMESACATYGILSALMLTMNVACFGSMEVDEWEAFKDGIGKQRCQEGAILGWRKANQSEVECIDDLVDVSEFLFVTLELRRVPPAPHDPPPLLVALHRV